MPVYVRIKSRSPLAGDLTNRQKQLILFSCIGVLMTILFALWGASLRATLASQPLIDATEDPNGTAAFFQNLKEPVTDILESAAEAKTTVQRRIEEAKQGIGTTYGQSATQDYQQQLIEELKKKLEQQ